MVNANLTLPMEFGSPVKMMMWVGTATTTGGVATFNPTSDGTGAGAAMFNTISYVLASARTNTGVAIAVPIASVKLVSADKKTVTVNAVIGTTLLALGTASVVFAPDGTQVDIMIIGS